MTDIRSDGSMSGQQVGYRNPPKSGQFVKGKSGNPQGRPRRPRTVSAATAGDSEYDRMFQEELIRQVSVREGGTVEKTSIERAATRAILLKAAKGDVKAFTAIRAKREAIENRRRVQHEERLRLYLQYKAAKTQELTRRKAACVSGPEIIPHPDDIDINPITGSILINGPISPDQKMLQDLFVSRWPTVERRRRNGPLFIAKDLRYLRQYARMKRAAENAGRSVAKRASKINSWDIATAQERINFLRRLLSESVRKVYPHDIFQTELCYKLMFQDWLGIEPTEDERQAFDMELREILLAP